ncbi:ElaA protein [Microdochium nivale]|nr:ElaA protein [Microdochium nivale]
MGTPFISLLEPTRLDGYDRYKPHDQQPAPHIPKVFCDAMEVREAVFVKEQGVPLEYEHDDDDSRSCHWVMYASVNKTTKPAQHDPSTGEVTIPRQSETVSVPIGTMRVVPFPHTPHPPPGAVYVGNVLKVDASARSGESEDQQPALVSSEDRETTYHDGKEPYVKIGRVAVVPEFRGHNVSAQLWRAARTWLEQNPAFFVPSITELGMDKAGITGTDEIPEWKGLVCCHAQESVVKVYERWGLKVDDKMGKWTEEGIPHVGMFIRVDVKKAAAITI